MIETSATGRGRNEAIVMRAKNGFVVRPYDPCHSTYPEPLIVVETDQRSEPNTSELTAIGKAVWEIMKGNKEQ